MKSKKNFQAQNRNDPAPFKNKGSMNENITDIYQSQHFIFLTGSNGIVSSSLVWCFSPIPTAETHTHTQKHTETHEYTHCFFKSFYCTISIPARKKEKLWMKSLYLKYSAWGREKFKKNKNL
jgi:hypothetical protein